MRTKVAAEIQKLEQERIIEKVSGPTEWLSRIVTPPKPKSPNEIRLCVDMRDANRAILRTRHITPTIDELTADLNGATVFSKLDLKSGYHQLELHPSCRYIRELTNRRLSHDDAVRLRDVTSAHAYMGTCQSRAKVDDVGEGDLQASRK